MCLKTKTTIRFAEVIICYQALTAITDNLSQIKKEIKRENDLRDGRLYVYTI